MLTYDKHPTKEVWIVKLDGQKVGEIRRTAGLYQYFPKGQKTGGDTFRSLENCKRSLES